MEASEFDFPDAPLDLLSEVFSKHIHSIFEESIRITRIPNILRSTLPSLTWFSDKTISGFKQNNWSDFDRKLDKGIVITCRWWGRSDHNASSIQSSMPLHGRIQLSLHHKKTFATRSSALQSNQLIRWRLFSLLSPTCELCSVRKSHLLEMKY